MAEFMKELWKSLGVKGLPSTAYHPQTDGQTEQVNQELEVYLRFYVNYQQDDWVRWLDQAEFIQHSNFQEAIQNTPVYLMHGFVPWAGREEGSSGRSPGASDWKRNLLEARKNATEALEKARESMTKFYNNKGERSREYVEGEKVWLSAKTLKTSRPSKKLDQRKLGPFTILEKIGQSSYRLQLPKSWNRIHPVFNEILLSPYHLPSFGIQEIPAPPGPVDQEGHPEYEVEDILAARKRGRGIQYLIKWHGYGNEENTWEPRRNVENAQEAIAEFYKQYPHAARRMIEILKTRIGKMVVEMKNGIEGVFETKTKYRKGYCQDALSVTIRRTMAGERRKNKWTGGFKSLGK